MPRGKFPDLVMNESDYGLVLLGTAVFFCTPQRTLAATVTPLDSLCAVLKQFLGLVGLVPACTVVCIPVSLRCSHWAHSVSLAMFLSTIQLYVSRSVLSAFFNNGSLCLELDTECFLSWPCKLTIGNATIKAILHSLAWLRSHILSHFLYLSNYNSYYTKRPLLYS
jgi:hypothetical protein